MATSDSSSSTIFLNDHDTRSTLVPLHPVAPSCSSSSQEVIPTSVSIPATLIFEDLAATLLLTPRTVENHPNYQA